MKTIPDLDEGNESEELTEGSSEESTETGEESEGGEVEEFAPSEVPPQFP